CTGRPPFRGDTGLAVLKRVCEDTPRPIREVNPDIPDTLAQIVDKLHAKKPPDRLTSAQEVADLLGQCLLELQRHGRTESPGDRQPSLPKPTSEVRRPHIRRWVAPTVALVIMLAAFGLTEATGFTNFHGTVIRLLSLDGTQVVVEVDDPGVSVRIDGGEIVITGAGAKEIRLKPGPHKLVTSKDGKPVREELVTVTKDGRQGVGVTGEGTSVAIGNEPAETPAPKEHSQAAPEVQ